MHHLERGTKDGATEVAAGVSKATLEQLEPGANEAPFGEVSAFVLGIGDDLSEFGFDVVGVLRLTTESGEDSAGFLMLSLLDEVTRRVGEEEETGGQDQAPSKLGRVKNDVKCAAE